MAGTNDLLRLERHSAGYTVSNIVAGMDSLLEEIFAEKPAVHVILAGRHRQSVRLGLHGQTLRRGR